MSKYTIYTDGACDGKKNAGSSAIVFVDGKLSDILICGYTESTNNRAELRGVLMALEYVKPEDDLVIISDSMYVINTLTSGWIEKWESINYEGKKNSDICRKLFKLKQSRNFTMKWVKGHNENLGNELADKFAVLARKSLNKLIDVNSEE